MELMDHTAVITGGTAGIGLESARLLASDGATVIISGRDRARVASGDRKRGVAGRSGSPPSGSWRSQARRRRARRVAAVWLS
ncbi:MAG: hypothetical protein QOH91_3094 [Mycobacterium sp.]|jgi:NAD(P)-dependent dehydrogenase (short-subunit alcohol dehydrogenase family)|nr:hypothetical protein [Mycobacterium sp.]